MFVSGKSSLISSLPILNSFAIGVFVYFLLGLLALARGIQNSVASNNTLSIVISKWMMYSRKKAIQICIEPQQDYVLATLARKKRVSKAEIIGESLDKYLKAIPVEEDPAIGIVGLGNSGKTDLSKGHDTYLAQYVRRKKR